jgi:glycosyltransferase involved in cell wall biosynthesis
VWEADRLPPQWGPWLRAVERVIVPCRWNAEVVARDVPGVPLHVVPHACDASAAPEPGPPPGGEFCFYTIGVWSRRKGLTETIEAFLRAFRREERVRLIVKTGPRVWLRPERAGPLARVWRKLARGGWPSSRRELARLCRRFPDAPPVELVTAALPPAQLRALHARGHAYVALPRAEGWGLGAFDAACRDRPVIMTGYGGQCDFLDREHASLVHYDLVECDGLEPELGWFYQPPQRWARPRLEHAVACLREMRRDPAGAAARAAELGAELRQRYAPARIAAALCTALAAEQRGVVR